MLDNNKNGINDKFEKMTDYGLVLVMLLVSIPAFFIRLFNASDMKFIFTLVTIITGGRTLLKEFISNKFQFQVLGGVNNYKLFKNNRKKFMDSCISYCFYICNRSTTR